jgi:hypothetical protein
MATRGLRVTSGERAWRGKSVNLHRRRGKWRLEIHIGRRDSHTRRAAQLNDLHATRPSQQPADLTSHLGTWLIRLLQTRKLPTGSVRIDDHLVARWHSRHLAAAQHRLAQVAEGHIAGDRVTARCATRHMPKPGRLPGRAGTERKKTKSSAAGDAAPTWWAIRLIRCPWAIQMPQSLAADRS